jgi:fumarylacetoacetase
MEALAPFRIAPPPRDTGDPPPLAYLDSEENRRSGGIDVTLEVALQSARMREQRVAPIRVCQSNLRHLYWTPAQLLAHHASNGCNLKPGDLLASGTVSGPTAEQRGCLLELTRRGKEPLMLPTGETRVFLEDGDEVILSACCERDGFARIAFGECRAVVTGAFQSD